MGLIDASMVAEFFAVGSIGFVAGVIMPWAFWLVGSLINVARKFTV